MLSLDENVIPRGIQSTMGTQNKVPTERAREEHVLVDDKEAERTQSSMKCRWLILVGVESEE